MEKNVFEKIIKNEIPSYKFYEDNHFIAILDINPLNPGHSLLIPKEKGENILKNNQEILDNIAKIAKNLSQKLLKHLEADSIRWQTNIGRESGQVIFHTHLHLVPFYKDKPKYSQIEEIFKLLKE